LQADYQEITDQVGVNFFRSPAHVILFKAIHPIADGGFDFSLGFHGTLAEGDFDLPLVFWFFRVSCG
jgi:hypothetical protein